MSDLFEEERRQSEKRRADYKLWQMEQALEGLRNKRNSEESEDCSYEDIAEAVRERVEALEKRVCELEGMVKELLKARVSGLAEAK